MAALTRAVIALRKLSVLGTTLVGLFSCCFSFCNVLTTSAVSCFSPSDWPVGAFGGGGATAGGGAIGLAVTGAGFLGWVSLLYGLVEGVDFCEITVSDFWVNGVGAGA